MSRLKLTINADSALAPLLKMQTALDRKDLMDDASAVLLHAIRTRFLATKSPEGIGWVESYAAKRRRSSGRGGGTLFDTGTLFHSLQIVRIGDSRAIETDVPYAKQHQFGLLGNETRPFLGANEDDVRRMSALIMNKLVGA